MSELKIVSDRDILSQKSENVTSVAEAQAIISSLTSVLIKTDGYGLSAIQIGIPKRVCVIKRPNKFIALINPEIVETKSPIVFRGEGCLSFPGIYENTNRFQEFVIKNQVVDGDSFREENQYFYFEPGGDIEGIVAQHEIDHMDGILFFQRRAEAVQPVVKSEKVGRNDKCPCGSGAKYKKCCGKNA